MHTVRFSLQDNTEVTLTGTKSGDFPYHIAINGTVRCQYDTFQHAWVDLGNVIGCNFLNKALEFL